MGLATDFALTLPAGVRMGCAEVPGGLSGTTVLLLPPGSTAGVDSRGGGPATHETNILAPGTLGYGADAVVLTGGSALGLSTTRGVQDALAESSVGCEPMPGVRVPIVPGAAIFDLGRGAAHVPDAGTGAAATRAAQPVAQRGSVGAGLGAWTGRGFARGGTGVASVVTDAGWRVTAVVTANPMGSVFDSRGELYASGVLAGYGISVPPIPAADLAEQLARAEALGATASSSKNTTIACLLTDAPLTDAQVTRLAAGAHSGLARAIYPSHTLFDGDTVFAASVPNPPEGEDTAYESAASALNDYTLQDLTWLGVAATDAMTLACVDAVLSADERADAGSSPMAIPAVRQFAPETVGAWESEVSDRS